MSQTKTLTVQEALNELKTLDSRIIRATNSEQLAGVQAEEILIEPRKSKMTIQEFTDNAEKAIQKARDLIAYRGALKRGVLQSNSVTKVTIDNVEYTVAEAIDLKSSIQARLELVHNILRSVEQSENVAYRHNERNDQKLEELKANFKNDDKNTQEAIFAKLEEDSKEKRATIVEGKVGKLSSSEWANNELDSIEKFQQSVDFKLTASNVVTEITIEW